MKSPKILSNRRKFLQTEFGGTQFSKTRNKSLTNFAAKPTWTTTKLAVARAAVSTTKRATAAVMLACCNRRIYRRNRHSSSLFSNLPGTMIAQWSTRIQVCPIRNIIPNFQFDPDPDPSTHFSQELDPPMLQNDTLRLPPFHFDADPDPTYHFDADPGPEPAS